MKKIVLVLISLTTWGSNALAEPLMRYSYLDVGLRMVEIDPSGYGGSKSDDLVTNLSISPIAHFALEAGYSYGKLDFGVNRQTFSYGALGYLSLTESLDLFAHAGGLYSEFRTRYYTDDGVGVYSGIGLRGLVTKYLEASGEVQFVDSLQQQWLGMASAVVSVHDNVAIRGQANINDNGDTSLLIGVRLTP